jgi:hypothetical protein
MPAGSLMEESTGKSNIIAFKEKPGSSKWETPCRIYALSTRINIISLADTFTLFEFHDSPEKRQSPVSGFKGSMEKKSWGIVVF